MVLVDTSVLINYLKNVECRNHGITVRSTFEV